MRARALLVALLVMGGVACTADDNGGGGGSTTTVGDSTTTTGTAAPLVADFRFEAILESSGDFCTPVGLELFDESTGEPTEWRWEFDDGEVLTEQNPTRDRVNYGEDVTLTVTRGDETDSVTQTIDGPVC